MPPHNKRKASGFTSPKNHKFARSGSNNRHDKRAQKPSGKTNARPKVYDDDVSDETDEDVRHQKTTKTGHTKQSNFMKLVGSLANKNENIYSDYGADPDDAEIKYLREKLGIKSTDDYGEKSSFIKELREDGFDEFFDVILPESTFGLEKGNERLAKFDLEKNAQYQWEQMLAKEKQLSKQRQKGSGIYEEEELESDSDSDAPTEVSSKSKKDKKKAAKDGKKTKDVEPVKTKETKPAKGDKATSSASDKKSTDRHVSFAKKGAVAVYGDTEDEGSEDEDMHAFADDDEMMSSLGFLDGLMGDDEDEDMYDFAGEGDEGDLLHQYGYGYGLDGEGDEGEAEVYWPTPEEMLLDGVELTSDDDMLDEDYEEDAEMYDDGEYDEEVGGRVYKKGKTGGVEIEVVSDEEEEEKEGAKQKQGQVKRDEKEQDDDDEEEEDGEEEEDEDEDEDESQSDTEGKADDDDYELKEDIYGRVVRVPKAGTAAVTATSTSSSLAPSAAPGKYVPPHLRRQLAAQGVTSGDAGAAMLATVNSFLANNDGAGTGNGPQLGGATLGTLGGLNAADAAIIRRKVKGVLNKVSAANVDKSYVELRSLLGEYSRGDVNEALCWNMLDTCANQPSITLSTLMAMTAMVSALHKQEGLQTGSVHMEHYTHKLKTLVEDRAAQTQRGGHYFTTNDVQVDAKASESVVAAAVLASLSPVQHTERVNALKQVLHLCSALCGLLLFRVLTSTFIFGLCQYITDHLSLIWDDKVEILTHILHRCGLTLRKDDPAALKVLIVNVQKSAATNSSQSSRTEFMLDTLSSVRNNKTLNYGEEEMINGLNRFITAAVGKNAIGGELTPGWKDVLEVEKSGRWWLVGAAFVQRGNFLEKDDKDAVEAEEESDSDEEDASAVNTRRLLAEAVKQGMNTKLRKAVFCIVMGSVDYMDAFEKLNRLQVPPSQLSSVIRVIMHCCSQEAQYNPFYAGILNRLTSYAQQYRFPCVCSVWDVIKELATEAEQYPSGNRSVGAMALARKTVNMGKLAADLVDLGGVDMYVLKKIEFEELKGNNVLFLHSFVMHLVGKKRQEDEWKQMLAPLNQSDITNYTQTQRDKLKEEMGLKKKKGNGSEGRRIKKGLEEFIVRFIYPMVKKDVKTDPTTAKQVTMALKMLR